MKKNNKRKLLLFPLLIILIIIGSIFIYCLSTLKLNNFDTIEINVSGSSKEIFAELKEDGIIKNDDIAYYYSRLFHDSNFKAGNYILKNEEISNINELIDYLSDSNNIIEDTVTLTFKDGYWLKDFAKVLSENTNLDYDDILDKWSDSDYIKELINDYKFLTSDILDEDVRYPLEGYLWPDTYEFFTVTNIDEVTRKLLDNTNIYYLKYESAIESSKYSINQLFSLASIVQYESGSSEYNADIAGVFYNRLDAGMLFQSSVTVCYAMDLDKNSEDGSACELYENQEIDSPYNTYKYAGFTPGPICAFNEDALKAVLYPSDNDYYYFIGDNNGHVYFAKNFEEHNQNICRYLGC